VYVDVEPEQGSDCSCLPSTEKGDMLNDPSAFSTNVPCWNCMIACGQDGLVAAASLGFPAIISLTANVRFETAL
jgi:hypothetical protein